MPNKEPAVFRWGKRARDWLTHDVVAEGHILRVQQCLAPYISQLPLHAEILDVAAGSNNAVYYPPDFNMAYVTAMDFSPEMLELNPSGVKKLVDINTGIPTPDDFYHLVVSVFGMRYFVKQEFVVLESLRVAKPGSWVVIVDFDMVMAMTGEERGEFDPQRLLERLPVQSVSMSKHEVIYKPANMFDSQLELLAVQKNEFA